jgi:hypothetical protein
MQQPPWGDSYQQLHLLLDNATTQNGVLVTPVVGALCASFSPAAVRPNPNEVSTLSQYYRPLRSRRR